MTCPRHGYPVVKAEHGQVFCDACFAEANHEAFVEANMRTAEKSLGPHESWMSASFATALAKRLRWQ